MEEELKIPTHLGFIVDGNRRWARERGLPTLEGHRKGFNQVEEIALASVKRGVKFTSFYLFSTENWDRSKEEVDYLMMLLRQNIKKLTKKFKAEGIRILWMGRNEPAPEDIQEQLRESEKETADGTSGTVCVCFNYGGQWEIADAMTKIIASGIKEVTPAVIAENLYHPEVPACDMIVRTSGEERISGFQLWRAAYSEFLFLDKYFPEMKVADLDEVLEEFASRHRRFGK